MKTIRWGIIGCGDVTEVKSGPGFQQAEHSALIAVMRRNGELAKDYAARHHVPKWYDNADALIHDPEVDAIYIATPPNLHKSYTILAAKAGKPVYVEKPMGLHYEECQEMINACKTGEVPLFVAFYRRALPRFNKIKELIENGVIGDVRLVNIVHYQKPKKQDTEDATLPWRVIPEISGGGRFVDVGCHTLDIMDYILGPIVYAQGTSANQAALYRADDIVSGHFVFASGIHGTGVWSFAAHGRFERNEIIGSKGKISFSTYTSDMVEITNEHGITQLVLPDPLHIQQPLIQTIVDELIGGKPCSSKGESAARTSWVMDQLMKTR